MELLEDTIVKYGVPEIFNTDQGSQFTSDEFTNILKTHGVKISMDGKGMALDNIFIERYWKSYKYESFFLYNYFSVFDAKLKTAQYVEFYNSRRVHSSLNYKTPDEIYFKNLPSGIQAMSKKYILTNGLTIVLINISNGFFIAQCKKNLIFARILADFFMFCFCIVINYQETGVGMVGQVYNNGNNNQDSYTYQVRPLNRVPAHIPMERPNKVASRAQPEAHNGLDTFKSYAMPSVYIAAAAGVIGLPLSFSKGSKNVKQLKSVNEQMAKISKVLKETLDLAGEKSSDDIIQDTATLREISTKDALTGLFNKRVYISALSKAAKTAKEYKKPTHMGMMDFDFFKSVNDVMGHDVGDKFIVRLGANIKAVTEKHGVSGFRFGGEEFGITMQGKNVTDAKLIIQEVATSIKHDPEIQNYKNLFLATAKKQLSDFRREQNINQKEIWDKIRGPQKEEEQAELAGNVLNHLMNNPTPVVFEEEASLLELQGALAGIVEKKQGAWSKFTQLFRSPKPQGITPLPVPEGTTVKSLYEKYPIMAKRLGGTIDRKKDIAAWESWIAHVEKNGFTISGGISNMQQAGYDAKVFEKKADEALDQAKKAGRNRVQLFGEKAE